MAEDCYWQVHSEFRLSVLEPAKELDRTRIFPNRLQMSKPNTQQIGQQLVAAA
jgi:hypothetical protein